GVGGRSWAYFFDSSRKKRFGPPGSQPGASSAACSVAGMTSCFIANCARYLGARENFRYSWAAPLALQLELMAHCHDPPPIFGPAPRSGGGRATPSAPSFDRFPEFQMPDQTMADLPLTKSAKASVPERAGLYPSLTRLCNQLAHLIAAAPLIAPSEVLKVWRSVRSPPKLCRNGE